MIRRHSVGIAALVMFASMMTPSCADAEAWFEFEKTLEVTAPIHLELSLTAGDVYITQGSGDRVVIKGIKRVWGQEWGDAKRVADLIQIEMKQGGNQVTIATNYLPLGDEDRSLLGKKFEGGVSHYGNVDYHITAPAFERVTIRAKAAQIELVSIDADISIDNSSGSVNGESLFGSLMIRQLSGEIDIQNVEGPIDIKNGSDVTHGKYPVGPLTIRIQNVEGSIDIENESGVVNGESLSGSLKIRQLSGDIDIQNVEGSINIKNGSDVTHGKNQGGPLTIRIQNVEGSIDIENRSGVTHGEFLVGPLSIRQAEGEIDLRWIEGDIRIKSVSSTVRIQQVSGAIDLESDDGDVYVRTELDSPRDYFVQTGSGAIVFSVPQRSAGALRMETKSGVIATELPVAVQSMTDNYLEGVFGRGGIRIELSSNSGDVTLAAY